LSFRARYDVPVRDKPSLLVVSRPPHHVAKR
jgi:hypothetical protein